jgi:hypothetical protein
VRSTTDVSAAHQPTSPTRQAPHFNFQQFISTSKAASQFRGQNLLSRVQPTLETASASMAENIHEGSRLSTQPQNKFDDVSGSLASLTFGVRALKTTSQAYVPSQEGRSPRSSNPAITNASPPLATVIPSKPQIELIDMEHITFPDANLINFNHPTTEECNSLQGQDRDSYLWPGTNIPNTESPFLIDGTVTSSYSYTGRDYSDSSNKISSSSPYKVHNHNSSAPSGKIPASENDPSLSHASMTSNGMFINISQYQIQLEYVHR